jgi:DNA repair exonuclease SbcCD ATPase subunit
MSQLNKLVLIDSYSKGKFTEVCLRGNVNLNGRNGCGKTTLLRVLPIFFGSAPGEIVREEGTNAGFADYYLPRSTSYIVYEYIRAGQVCCVVASRKPGSKTVGFRFVEGAYEPSWFIEKKDRDYIIPNQDWKRIMELRNFQVSSQFGVDDYRAIIQSNHNFQCPDRSKRDRINQSRRRFSFPVEGGSMENVHLVAAAILEREPSIRAIKELLETILINQGDLAESELLMQVHEGRVDEWIGARKAWLKIEEQVSNIKSLVQLKERYQRLQENLSDIKSLAEQRLAKLNAEHEELFNKIQLDTKERNHQATLRGEKIQSFNQAIEKLNDELRGIERQIKSLEFAHNSFKKGGIEEKQALVKRTDELFEAKESAEKAVSDLESGLQDIVTFFQKEKEAAQERFNQANQDLLEQKKNIEIEFRDQSHLLKETKSAAIEKIKSRAETPLAHCDSQLHEKMREKGQLEGRLSNVSAPAELLKELEDKRDLLTVVSGDLDAQDKTITEANTKAEELREALEKQVAKFNQLDRQVAVINDEISKARGFYQPKDGTLLSFLRENVDGWGENIARVIDPELLMRTDLHPQQVEPSDGLYGVGLALSGINIPSVASTEAMETVLKELDERLYEIEKARNDAKTEASSLRRQKKEADIDVSRETLNANKLKEELARIRGEIDAAKLLCEEAKAKEMEKLEEAFNQCGQAIKGIKDQKDDIIRKRKEDVAAEEGRYQNALNKLTSDIDDAIKGIDDRLESARKALKAKVKSIDEDESQAIAKQGCNEAALKHARKTAQQTSDEHRKAKDAAIEVEQYNHFMANEWPALNGLKDQETDLKVKIETCGEKKDNELRAFDDVIEVIDKRLLQSRPKLDDLDTEKTMVENLLNRLVEVKSAKQARELSSIHTATYLSGEVMKVKNEIKGVIDAGPGLYNPIKRAFRTSEGSAPGEYFQVLIADLSAADWSSQLEWVMVADKLHDYLEESHQDHASLVKTQALNIGQEISDFSQQLERIHSKISSLGNLVTNETEKVILSFDAIKGLKMNITSSMNKLGYWDSLRRFSSIHLEWKAMGGESLPSDDYIDRLESIKSLLGSTGLSVNVKESFGVRIEVDDQGQVKVATNDRDLKTISSNGLSYLIMILAYMALANLLRGNRDSVLAWPIDELKDFDKENAISLIQLLRAQNITVLSAFPDADPDILCHYDHTYEIQKETRMIYHYGDMVRSDTDKEVDSILSAHLAKQAVAAEQELEGVHDS